MGGLLFIVCKSVPICREKAGLSDLWRAEKGMEVFGSQDVEVEKRVSFFKNRQRYFSKNENGRHMRPRTATGTTTERGTKVGAVAVATRLRR